MTLPTAPAPPARRGAARTTLLWILGALAALAAATCTFSVRPGETVVVARFGDLRRTVDAPGLHLRLPAPLDTLYRIDMREHVLDLDVAELLTKESRSLEVDAFASWHVLDPRTYLASLRSREGADARLGDALLSTLTEVFRRTEQAEIIRVGGSDRDLAAVAAEVRAELQALCDDNGYGVRVTLAGIERVTFTADNMAAIERKMREERQGEQRTILNAAQERAATVEREASKQVADIESEATKLATEIRGNAVAEARRIENETMALAPDLYRFQRELEIAERVLAGGVLVLDADHPLLGVFRVLETLRSGDDAGGDGQ